MPDPTIDATPNRAAPRASKAKPIVWLLAVVVCLGLARYLNAPALLRQALDWIQGLGAWGPFIFVGLYVLATVLFLPGSILTLGAGVVFGVIKGAILVSISATLGATAAFFVSRHLVRGWVARQLAGNTTFAAIDDAVSAEGWKIVGLTRLSPVFPFNLLNYAFGVTRVKARDYIVASWIGMMPGTVMYVYLGSLAGNLATLGNGEQGRTPVEWALYAVGLMATVAVTLYVTRRARAALKKRISS